jgi:hypothetical protein
LKGGVMALFRSTTGRSVAWLLATLSIASRVEAREIVAVLSSRLAPYSEALAGFQERLGYEVPVFDLASGDPRIDHGTRVVVAFGGKASLRLYPDVPTLVYCMAPGTDLETAPGGATIRVWMLPPPAAALPQLLQIQPGLRRLAVFWAAMGNSHYVVELNKVAARCGIEIHSERVSGATEIPAALRAFAPSSSDAVWLIPDPLLVTESAFEVFREFSWSNRVPFYAPNQGLVEKGAAASVSVSFREIGRAAAQAALVALAGSPAPSEVFPEKSETTINLTAAGNSGLRPADDVLHRADKVLP